MKLWDSLSWVRPRQGSDQWEACRFEEIDVVRVDDESGKKSRKERKKQTGARRVLFPQGEEADTRWL